MGAWDEYKKLVEAHSKEELDFKLIQKDEDYTIDFNGLDLTGSRTIEHYFKDGKFMHVVTKIESDDYNYIQIESDGNKTEIEENVKLEISNTTSGEEAQRIYERIQESVNNGDLTYSEEKTTKTNKPIQVSGKWIKDSKETTEHYYNSNGRFAYSVVKHEGEDYEDIYIDEYKGGRLNFCRLREMIQLLSIIQSCRTCQIRPIHFLLRCRYSIWFHV